MKSIEECADQLRTIRNALDETQTLLDHPIPPGVMAAAAQLRVTANDLIVLAHKTIALVNQV